MIAALFGVASNAAVNTFHPPRGAAGWIWATTVVLLVSWILVELDRHRRDRQATSAVDLDTTAAQLATGVGRLLRAQEHQWQVHDPYPLPVRWTLGPATLTDHWANICRTPPAANADPLDLAGNLDEITTVYQRIPSGRLVVLGKAGAGKTILAGRLVAGLLATRAAGDPVPVIFNLSTWNPNTASLETWLAAQLIENHPGLADPGPTGATLAADLVTTQRILPVLDGFDEIAPGLHHAALAALNRTSTPLVLTSRPKKYHNAVTRTDVLTAAALITLADLTVTDLADYLTRASSPTTRTRWAPVLATLTTQPPTPAAALAQALRTPLMVYLARTVYSDTPHHNPAELLDPTRYPTASAIEMHLLNALIPATYTSPTVTGKPGRRFDNPTKALRWHTHLATHLHQLGSHDLAWWQLRDTVPRTARFLTVGLAVGLPFGIISGIAVDWMYGYGFGLPGGYMAGLISRSATGPRPQQTQFHLRGHISTLLKPTAVGLLCGLAGGLLFDLAGWLAIGLVLGLGGGLLLLMEDLAVTPKVDAVFSPPDLLRMDRSRTVSIMVMVGLLFGALGLTDGFIDGLQFGVAYALGIMLASAAWVQWLVCTRLWLPATGKLPWRIIAFLTDAHQRGVLRQAGGVYRYRHALLRDQLAHHTTDPRPQPHHQPQHNSPNPKRPPPPAHTCQRSKP